MTNSYLTELYWTKKQRMFPLVLLYVGLMKTYFPLDLRLQLCGYSVTPKVLKKV